MPCSDGTAFQLGHLVHKVSGSSGLQEREGRGREWGRGRSGGGEGVGEEKLDNLISLLS